MEKWQCTALILCCFGFFKELRPSEPFVTKYLIDYKGFSKETIVQVAYPIATYTYLAALPIFFLITDFLRYRSIIILEAAAFVATFSMLIWTNGLFALKIIEILYGIAGASEIAYYTYMYAKVDRSHYKKVTSYTYSTIFAGNFIAAVLSQLMVSFDLMNYHELNFLSLSGVTIALFFALLLPSVNESIYFYRRNEEEEAHENIMQSTKELVDPAELGIVVMNNNCSSTLSKLDNHNQQEKSTTEIQLSFIQRIHKAYPILWLDFKKAYTKPDVVKWSVWWAIATAGHLQITNYYQSLWEEIEPVSEDGIYNGAVSAVQSALSAILAFGVGHVNVDWSSYGESFLCLISIFQGADLIWFSQTGSLITGYILLAVYRTLYQILITIASAEVAQGIDEDSYGLIFGINTFGAVFIQTILTLVINEKWSLALDIRPQFLVYGCYYILLGVIFFIVGITTIIVRKCYSNSSKLNLKEDLEL